MPTIDRQRARIAATAAAVTVAAADTRRVAVAYCYQFAAVDDHRATSAALLGITVATTDRGR